MMQPKLSDSDRAWIGYYEKRRAAGFAPIRGGRGSGGRGNVLAVIRAAAPRAYDAIMAVQPAEPLPARHIRCADDGGRVVTVRA